MAVPFSLKDAVVTITDDSGGAHALTVSLEDGDLSISFPNTTAHQMDRGDPGALYDGPFEPITWSMSAVATEFTGGATLLEAVQGQATSWTYGPVVTGSGDYNGFTSDLQDAPATEPVFQMKVVYTNAGTGTVETLYLLDNTASVQFAEGMPNKFTLNGTSYMKVSSFHANATAV